VQAVLFLGFWDMAQIGGGGPPPRFFFGIKKVGKTNWKRCEKIMQDREEFCTQQKRNVRYRRFFWVMPCAEHAAGQSPRLPRH